MSGIPTQGKANTAQQLAKDYVEKHKLDKVLGDMLNTIVHQKEEEPLIYMIKYLCSLCTVEELSNNRIQVDGPLPVRLPVLKYPIFPDSCKSMLKKHLTPHVWRQLRTTKTEYDARLFHCILAGIQNVNLPIGVYASDPTAYTKFKTLFQPIIYDLHNYDMDAGTKFTHNYNIGTLDWHTIQNTGRYIKYLQISGSRNLGEFGFLPMLDSYKKHEIENIISRILSEDIDGKYNILKLSSEEKELLSEDNLLFSKHPCYEDLLSEHKWGEGTAIYYAKDLSYVIHINAEDHVKLIITQKPNSQSQSPIDLKAAFQRLFGKLQFLEQKAKLAKHDNLGFLTVCPSNLGTGLRASVIVELEKVEHDLTLDVSIQNICLSNHVELKRLGNKKYSFSSGKTLVLGRSECDMVQGMFQCIQALLAQEEELIRKEKEKMEEERKQNALQHQNLIQSLQMPKFHDYNTSLVKGFIDQQLWAKLSRNTTPNGFKLSQCIAPGILNHKIGLVAYDAECYGVFQEIFKKIISVFHEDFNPDVKDLIPSLKLANLEELQAKITQFGDIKFLEGGYLQWEANLFDYNFCCGFKNEDREEVNSKLLSILENIKLKNEMKLYPLEDCPEEIRSFPFFEDLLGKQDKIESLTTDWPKGRNILVSPKNLCILTNVNNHIAVCQPITESTLVEAIMNFLEVYFELNKAHEADNLFSLHPVFGFLNTFPTDIGNGIIFKLVLKGNEVIDYPHYLSLSEGFPVTMSIIEQDKNIALTHKKKFTNITNMLMDVIQVAKRVCIKEEELRNTKPSVPATVESSRDEEEKISIKSETPGIGEVSQIETEGSGKKEEDNEKEKAMEVEEVKEKLESIELKNEEERPHATEESERKSEEESEKIEKEEMKSEETPMETEELVEEKKESIEKENTMTEASEKVNIEEKPEKQEQPDKAEKTSISEDQEKEDSKEKEMIKTEEDEKISETSKVELEEEKKSIPEKEESQKTEEQPPKPESEEELKTEEKSEEIPMQE